MGLMSQRDKTVAYPSFIFDIQSSDHQLGSLRIDNATSGGRDSEQTTGLPSPHPQVVPELYFTWISVS